MSTSTRRSAAGKVEDESGKDFSISLRFLREIHVSLSQLEYQRTRLMSPYYSQCFELHLVCFFGFTQCFISSSSERLSTLFSRLGFLDSVSSTSPSAQALRPLPCSVFNSPTSARICSSTLRNSFQDFSYG